MEMRIDLSRMQSLFGVFFSIFGLKVAMLMTLMLFLPENSLKISVK